MNKLLHWRGKFRQIAHDSPNSPIFPHQIFPVYGMPICDEILTATFILVAK